MKTKDGNRTALSTKPLDCNLVRSPILESQTGTFHASWARDESDGLKLVTRSELLSAISMSQTGDLWKLHLDFSTGCDFEIADRMLKDNSTGTITRQNKSHICPCLTVGFRG
jgi:hypothetical protein